MLPVPHRLPKQHIAGIMRSGSSVPGDGILLKYKKTGGLPRFAFVVSTKIDRRATQRNRNRRLLSESVRHLMPRIRPADAVIIVRKKNIALLPQTAAEKLVADTLTRAGLI